ncbi:MAG: type II toxin-antitoxin system death-on-curing family toxin [Deltaproteobacteria bacterium]|nr:type II toxin-antitoxin system death-on-curing family toxin [Deltaproteobacteria bacterium]
MSNWGNSLPAKVVHYLTRDEAVVIHHGLIERFGGLEGVRDLGLLESALYRPRTGYYHDLAEMAAALFESLLMNHAYIDGNKRVAFFATDIFLRLNGWKLKVVPEAAHEFLIGLLERKECDFEHLLPWIRNSLVRLPSRR